MHPESIAWLREHSRELPYLSAEALFNQATRLGLELSIRGDMLAVVPKSKCPQALLDGLRENKVAVIAYMQNRKSQ